VSSSFRRPVTEIGSLPYVLTVTLSMARPIIQCGASLERRQRKRCGLSLPHRRKHCPLRLTDFARPITSLQHPTLHSIPQLYLSKPAPCRTAVWPGGLGFALGSDTPAPGFGRLQIAPASRTNSGNRSGWSGRNVRSLVYRALERLLRLGCKGDTQRMSRCRESRAVRVRSRRPLARRNTKFLPGMD